MQRPSGGYRGGVRVGRQNSRNHHINDEQNDDDNVTLSNSNSDENDDLDEDDLQQRHNCDIKAHSSMYSKLAPSSDFESAIRNLRPSVTRQKKSKISSNISKQKADLPQLNTTNENNSLNKSANEGKYDEKPSEDQPQRQWFPKPDVGHVDSDAFIRHNHVGT